MENKILEKNLKLISKYNTDLAEKIANISSLTGNYEIKDGKSGDSILYQDGMPVDNELDPVWDAIESYNALPEKTNRGITVLYGLGLGYVLKEFAKRYQGKIIVYEPNLEILRISMELVDFSAELNSNDIRITSNFEEIKISYHSLFFHNYKLNIVPINYYKSVNTPQSGNFKAEIEKIQGVYQSNYSNLMYKATKWTLCLFHNIPKVLENQDLHVLKDKFKGKTAVIISAGPSLDKNIEDLKPYRDKVAVFCVGTALKTAIKHGITPDFTVAIETSPTTKNHLDIPEIKDLKLITSSNVFNGVFDLQPECFLNYHINKENSCAWLGNLLDVPKNEYETAGTVSIIALYSAKMLGFNKIILVGQDLAYTDNKCYSKDSDYGAYEVDSSKKINVNDQEKFKKDLNLDEKKLDSHVALLGKDLYYIKGQNGEKILSRSDLMLFIVYFEEIAEKLGHEIKFINSTEGGANINGFENLPLKESLRQYTDNDIDKTIITPYLKLDKTSLTKRKDILLRELNAIIKNSRQLEQIAADTVNKHLIPCLSRKTVKLGDKEFRDFARFFEIKFINSLNDLPLSDDDKQFMAENTEIALGFIDNFNAEVEELLKNNPDKFAKSLKALKDNYFIMKDVVLKNFFLKNFAIKYFLVSDNLIKDFVNTDEELIALFKQLSNNFMLINNYIGSMIKFLKRITGEIY